MQLRQKLTPYKHNGKELDQFLIALVSDIADIPLSEHSARETAIDRFLQAIYTLPNLHHPNNARLPGPGNLKLPKHKAPMFLGEYERLLEEEIFPDIRTRIGEFNPTGAFLAETLANWINKKIGLARKMQKKYKEEHVSGGQVSLDNQEAGANERLEWQIFAENPTLSGLDRMIADQQAQDSLGPMPMLLFEATFTGVAKVLGSTPTQRFIDYVNQDPDGLLTSKVVPQNPECTYQVLIQRLKLSDPPAKKKAIAKEFNIEYQALNAHYIRHVDPVFINRIILEQGFFQEAAYPILRQYIESDSRKRFQTCCMTKKPALNAQFLALRRLRCCHETAPQPFEAIAQDPAILPYRLTPKQIEKFWNTKAVPLVAQLAMRVLAYDLEV